ncbi:MAG TPA: hypothetical protein VFB60_20385 [Ktedonobacteraceae bacterium]|nr:hypothetical protein [Ktedonobacteraceae bacterium]
MKMMALEVLSFLCCHLIKKNSYACNDASSPLNEPDSSQPLFSALKPIINDQSAITWLNPIPMRFYFEDFYARGARLTCTMTSLDFPPSLSHNLINGTINYNVVWLKWRGAPLRW